MSSIAPSTPKIPAPASTGPAWAGLLTFYRRRWLAPFLFFLLLVRLVMRLWLLGELAPARVDLSFPEGALVARALDVLHGQTPYHDWRQWPHAFAPYGPLTYYSVGWLARAVGGPGASYHIVYVTGRLFSLACLLGCLGVIYALGRRCGCNARMGLSRGWAWVALAFLPEWTQLLIYSISYRPDAPRTLFALLALWFMVQEPARGGGLKAAGRILAVLACLYVSLWFKPTAWAVTALAGVWLWRGLGARRGLTIYAGFLAGGLGLFYLLDRHWGGLLRLNMIDSLNNGFSFGLLKGLLTETPWIALVILFGGALAALATLPGHRSTSAPDDGPRLFALAVPLTLLVSLAQGLKLGADLNYLLEAYLLAALAAAGWAARLWRGELALRPVAREVLCGLLAAPLLCSLYLQISNFRMILEADRLGQTPIPIAEVLHQQPGPVLAANPFLALAAPAPWAILDHYQYKVLWQRGLIDPAPLLERVARCEFSLIVLYEDSLKPKPGLPAAEQSIYCPSFITALLQHYYVHDKQGAFLLLAPKR